MSRKKTNKPQQVNSGRWRKRNVMIVIAVVLSLFASWTLLAYSGALDSLLRRKKKAGGEASIQSFNSNSPSKEYVYAGGRLIATEEPGSAQGKINPVAVTASNTGAGFSTSMAVDGALNTFWSSGGYPVQWIQLDLGQSYSVSQIRLNASQYPAGLTTHEIYAGPQSQTLSLLTTLSGSTQGGQWLEVNLSPPAVNVRYLKINTTSSPSWVSWTEIEVYGTPSGLIKLNPISVTASNAGSGFSTSMATDSNVNTFWSSGGAPVQWIQLDLWPELFGLTDTVERDPVSGRSDYPRGLWGRNSSEFISSARDQRSDAGWAVARAGVFSGSRERSLREDQHHGEPVVGGMDGDRSIRNAVSTSLLEPPDLGGTPITGPGTLIGKAIEPLAKGVGVILVLLSLQ